MKFVIHFIGDLHQPLHTENLARGGNEIPVCFRKACARTNLHGVWDREIVHKIVGLPSAAHPVDEKAAAQQWADLLVGPEMVEGEGKARLLEGECSDVADPDKCSMAWAQESNAYICSYVLKPGIEWVKTHDLSLDYYDGAAPIVAKQITSAGVRLAAWLEAMIAVSKSLGVRMRPVEERVMGNLEF